MNEFPLSLTLGPLLFNWPAPQILDFYRRIAWESDISTRAEPCGVCTRT